MHIEYFLVKALLGCHPSGDVFEKRVINISAVLVRIGFIRYDRNDRQILFNFRPAFQHPRRCIAGVKIARRQDGVFIAAQLRVGDRIRSGKHIVTVTMFDCDLVSVACVISAESFGIPGLNDFRDRFLQNVGLQGHVMVSDYVDQLYPTVGHIDQLVDNVLIVGYHVLVKLSCIRVAGIIDRQKPLVQKITVDDQLSHICCALQAPQELYKQRTVFQCFCIAVIDAEVNIAYDDGLVSCVAGIPQSCGALRCV
ncbi:hypothetical protein SDC9_106229 [bioreactor metagenome]|uniref:Uncharacterized protein n=1 Tax=bioreactor metagenome TaxID=1076179 RepID=A0A645B1V9_9ZZZZ